MSMCRIFCCVVERGCLLWPVHFLGKTLLVFALLQSAFQGQICLLLQVFLSVFLSFSLTFLRRRQWHPTPVILSGKSHGRRSLVGCSPWGRKESDTTEWLPFHFHALKKEMATHSSVLAWRIPGTEEPGRLPSMWSHRVGLDWSDLAARCLLTFYFWIPIPYNDKDNFWGC